jgi:hypothetical protein
MILLCGNRTFEEDQAFFLSLKSALLTPPSPLAIQDRQSLYLPQRERNTKRQGRKLPCTFVLVVGANMMHDNKTNGVYYSCLIVLL